MTKSEKMIKMLDLICEEPGLDATALSKRCSVSERGIYRYIATLRSVGVYIKYRDGGYRIEHLPTYFRRSLRTGSMITATIELVTLGMVACKDPKLEKKGVDILRLLNVSRA